MSRLTPRLALASALLIALSSLPTSHLAAQSRATAVPRTPGETGTLVLQPGAEGKDASVSSTNPSTNYGTAQWFYSIGLPAGAGFVEFDLAAVPAGAVVTAAQLELWGEYRDGTVTLDAVSAGWDETTLTWATRPGTVSPSLALSYPVSRGAPSGPCYWGCTMSFDVTSIAHAWIEDGVANHGFRIVGDTPGIGWMMASSDNVSYPRPLLRVQYDVNTPVSGTSWGQLKTLYR
jgi:hypothetical protein